MGGKLRASLKEILEFLHWAERQPDPPPEPLYRFIKTTNEKNEQYESAWCQSKRATDTEVD